MRAGRVSAETRRIRAARAGAVGGKGARAGATIRRASGDSRRARGGNAAQGGDTGNNANQRNSMSAAKAGQGDSKGDVAVRPPPDVVEEKRHFAPRLRERPSERAVGLEAILGALRVREPRLHSGKLVPDSRDRGAQR